ncbi:MAG: hypothetical protein HQ546_03975 [Planctomycetes bacterium]|nr:hypothetical protein [Planctomycetota bacterium]
MYRRLVRQIEKQTPASANRFLVLLAVSAFLVGCVDSGRKSNALATQSVEQDKQINELRMEVVALRLANDAQAQQVRQLQAFGPDRLEKLFRVERIRLSSHTGGYGSNATGAHEGVRVLLQPIDTAGSVIKAAGDVTIALYDLAETGDNNRIGEYHFGVDTIGKYWFGGIFTNRYVFECPWQQGAPAHSDITIRATFVEALTGKNFTAQGRCTVNLPTAPQPARQ